MLGDVKGFQVTASEWQNPGVNHYVRHPRRVREPPPWVAEPVAFLRETGLVVKHHPCTHRQIHSASASWPQPTATTREAGQACWRSLWGTLHTATQTARNK